MRKGRKGKELVKKCFYLIFVPYDIEVLKP